MKSQTSINLFGSLLLGFGFFAITIGVQKWMSLRNKAPVEPDRIQVSDPNDVTTIAEARAYCDQYRLVVREYTNVSGNVVIVCSKNRQDTDKK